MISYLNEFHTTLMSKNKSNHYHAESKRPDRTSFYTSMMQIAIAVGLVVIMMTFGVIHFNKSGQNGSYGALIFVAFMFIVQVLVSIASLVLMIVNLTKQNKNRVLLSVVNFVIWVIGLLVWSQN